MRTIPLQGIDGPVASAATSELASPSGEASFDGVLNQALNGVEALQLDADRESAKAALGGGNLHELSLALEKADVAMRVATKVRNKIVDAYHDVMRMSI